MAKRKQPRVYLAKPDDPIFSEPWVVLVGASVGSILRARDAKEQQRKVEQQRHDGERRNDR